MRLGQPGRIPLFIIPLFSLPYILSVCRGESMEINECLRGAKMPEYPRNEAKLVEQIVKMIRETFPSAWVLKTHGNGYQRGGVPDLLIVLDGRLYAFEVKHQKPGESVDHLLTRVSQLQIHELEQLREAGATAEVVWHVSQARRILSDEVWRY